MRGTKLTAALLLAVVFVVGGFTGMAMEEALGIDWFEFLDDEDDDSANSLLGGLDLTAAQRERADGILEREEDRLEDYWETRLPEIQSILDSTYAEIRATLDPEQQAAFDQRVRELRGRVPEEIRD